MATKKINYKKIIKDISTYGKNLRSSDCVFIIED